MPLRFEVKSSCVVKTVGKISVVYMSKMIISETTAHS